MRKNNFIAIFISYILLIMAFVVYFTFHNIWLEAGCIFLGFLILIISILSRKSKYKLTKIKKELPERDTTNTGKIGKINPDKKTEKIGAEEIAELWEEMEK